MIKELIQYLKEHKYDFAPTREVNYSGGCDTCGYGGSGEDVNDCDMDALWKSIENFEKSFQEGGTNAHRNPNA